MIHKTPKQHTIERKRIEAAKRRKYGLCLKDKPKRTYSMDHKPYEGMLNIESQPTVSDKEIRDKAIEELKDKICSHFADWQYTEDDKRIKDIIELASESVEEIAEQMKKVGENELQKRDYKDD